MQGFSRCLKAILDATHCQNDHIENEWLMWLKIQKRKVPPDAFNGFLVAYIKEMFWLDCCGYDLSEPVVALSAGV